MPERYSFFLSLLQNASRFSPHRPQTTARNRRPAGTIGIEEEAKTARMVANGFLSPCIIPWMQPLKDSRTNQSSLNHHRTIAIVCCIVLCLLPFWLEYIHRAAALFCYGIASPRVLEPAIYCIIMNSQFFLVGFTGSPPCTAPIALAADAGAAAARHGRVSWPASTGTRSRRRSSTASGRRGRP